MSYRDRSYHFYFDEGGMLGNGSVLISDRPLRKKDNCNHISNYKVGKLPYASIIRYIQLWKLAFGQIPISIKIISDHVTSNSILDSINKPNY